MDHDHNQHPPVCEVEVLRETSVYLTRQEIEEIVSSAVTSAFRDLGISCGTKASLEEAREFRADLQFLHEWRELCEMMRNKGFATTVGMAITALGGVILLGIAAWVKQFI